MSIVYVSADSLKPSNHLVEQAYYYGDGSGGTYGPPVLMDTGDGEGVSLLPSGNTAGVFAYGGAIYRLLNRQQVFASVMVKSTDNGLTWTVLDSANSPLFESLSGYLDGSTVYCAFISANPGPAAIKLINFDLLTGTWGAVYGVAGGPTSQISSSVTVYKYGTLLTVLYQARAGFAAAQPSGIGATQYDLSLAAWSGVLIDAGAALTSLPLWDSTQMIVSFANTRSTMDTATGIIHLVFSSTSATVAAWSNRVFYQAINPDLTYGSFNDFPGQVAPFPAFPRNQQQLNVYSGPPFGSPVIVGTNILLPVSQRNDNPSDRFPVTQASLYIGTPVSAPVWSLLPGYGTIDPEIIIDDFIWIQQAPSLAYDGTNLYIVYSAQDTSGQNLARLRFCVTADLTTFATWSASTIFDLQVSPSPPGFQFGTQFLSGAGAFVSAVAPPPVFTGPLMIDTRSLGVIPLPNPNKC